jgi:hypothetical protein
VEFGEAAQQEGGLVAVVTVIGGAVLSFVEMRCTECGGIHDDDHGRLLRPYDVEIVANPYPVYARLREEAPIGANLARLEGRVALDELLNRWPEWDVDYETAELAPTSTVRGWERLRLVLP